MEQVRRDSEVETAPPGYPRLGAEPAPCIQGFPQT